MTSVDRIQGLSGSIAVKSPCRVATTAAITLSGEQTIDGVAVVSGDRVLVKDQASSVDNGIYDVSTGHWSRTLDFNGINDARNGTLVAVVAGSTNVDDVYRVVGTDPIIPGTSAITFVATLSSQAATDFAHVLTDTPIRCTNVYDDSGTTKIYELTAINLPSTTPAALVNGFRFRFTPAASMDGGAAQIDCTDFTNGPLYLFAPNGRSLVQYYDVQEGVPLSVEYRTDLEGFTTTGFRIVDQVATLGQIAMPHGTCKLQTDGGTSISFTQEDGRGILVWDPNRAAFRQHNMAVITNASLFTAANYVEGVANTALSVDTLYAVYLYDPGNSNTLHLDFWPMYDGGGEAWTFIVNEIGINVKRATKGGAGADNTRTYLGMLYTKGGDVSTSLSGAVVALRCQSHFKVWRFPFVVDDATVSGFTSTSFVAQSVPRVEFVTEGLTDTGYFQLHCNHYSNGAGNLGEVKLKITGTAYNGAPFSAESEIARATTPAINGYVNLNVAWGVALPMGQFTVQPSIRVNAGTGVFELSMSGYVAN